MTKERLLALAAVVAFVAARVLSSAPLGTTIFAIGAGYLIFRIGFVMLGGISRPIPEPPPPGELRKVKIMFRCSLCGTEVRMTVANDEMPEPPRHCMEDMELVAPVME